METTHDGDSGLSERDLHDSIVVEVSRFTLEHFPSVISSFGDELISVAYKGFRVL